MAAQKKAIRNLEQSLANNKPRALIQMATGSGKTFTAVNAVYRLVKFADARRVLFLVDRTNLGTQALNEFQRFITPDDGRKFTELYNVQHMTTNVIDPDGRVCVTTIQRLYSILKGEAEFDEESQGGSLFEAGAGETIRRKLLHETNLHTILRLPAGVFYKQGLKANVLFFDNRPSRKEPWTKEVWYYDLRTNMHFTLKQNPLQLADLREFIDCYRPGKPLEARRPTWSEENEDGRWRNFSYDELMARDKVNLDIFWLRDESSGGLGRFARAGRNRAGHDRRS